MIGVLESALAVLNAFMGTDYDEGGLMGLRFADPTKLEGQAIMI